MDEISIDEVRALARAAGIEIDETELTEVAHHLRAIIEAMDAISVPGISEVQPMPMPASWPPDAPVR